MKYLVTDPCYLLDLDSDTDHIECIWEDCMNDLYDSNHCSKYSETNLTGVQKTLSRELGIKILRVSDTGFGDWSNSISSFSDHIRIIKSDFCADSGMMCVVEINDKLENFLKDNDIGAIFESDVPISVHVNDSNPNWYVLEISDRKGFLDLVSSEEPEVDEYIDEDFDEEF